MTAKYAVLMVVAVVLSACGTTSEDDAKATAPGKRLVVRGAVVPDEPESAAVKPKKAPVRKAAPIAVADASSVPETTSGSDATSGTTAPMVAPNTSGGGGNGSGGGGGTSATTDPSTSVAGDASSVPTAPSPSDVTTTPLAPVEPSTVSAEPVGDAAPPPTPSPLAIDFRDMLNTTIAGFPLWLMVVVGILLAAALVFGTGGGRRERTPERDYRDDREPDYDDRTYADRHGDAEPEPA
jgi:hypothetical protein